MAYRSGAAYGYMDLLKMLKGFVESSEMIDNIVYTGATGNGYLSGERCEDAATNETWTITFTSSTAFTVSGSTSGSQTNIGTVGTEYSSDGDEVTFTVIAGGTAFVTSDVITFQVVSGIETQKWTVKEYGNSDIDGSPEKQLIIMGPGTSGSDEIYCGIRTYSNAGSNLYNWALQGFTGYNAASTWTTQPGQNTSEKHIYLDDNTKMPYWIKASGRRIIMVVDIAGVYEWMYLGFLLPYGYPNEFPYPLFIGGCGFHDTYIASTTSYNLAFWNGSRGPTETDGPGAIYTGEAWTQCCNFTGTDHSGDSHTDTYPHFWPTRHGNGAGLSGYAGQFANLMTTNIDGSYFILPFILWRYHETYRAVYGELDGIFWIQGDGMSAETEFTLDSKDYIVFPNTYKSDNMNWAAFLKE